MKSCLLKKLNFETKIEEELSENLKLYLKLIISEYLHIEDISEIPNDLSVFNQGITSLNAVEIQYKIEEFLSIKMEASDFFNYSTIDKLVSCLVIKKLNYELPINKNSINESVFESENISGSQVAFENNACKVYARGVIKKDFDI